MKSFIILIAIYLIVSGCAPAYTNKPVTYNIDRQQGYYVDNDMEMLLSANNGMTGFVLQVLNKSKNNLIIDWNNSYFINNGTLDGGFILEGMKYVDMNNKKPDTVLLPNFNKSMEIWPIVNIYSEVERPNTSYAGLSPGLALESHRLTMLSMLSMAASGNIPVTYKHKFLGEGYFGVYLNIKGKKINKNIQLVIRIIKNQ